MMTKNKLFGGPVTIYTVQNKIWTPIETKPQNMIVYEGSDILGKLLSGATDYVVNTAYFEFDNSGSPPSVTPTKSGGQSYFSGLSGTQDFLRTTIDLTPVTSASDSDYTYNKVTFTLISTGTSGYHGLTFSAGAGSQVYGAALAASPTGAFSGDLVFARIYFTPISKAANVQIGLTWPITIP